jgi:peptide/nickel transport system permease protein
VSFKRFLIVRLAWALVGAWLATVLVFALFFVVPEEPVRLVAGPQAPPGALERARDQLGLDDPLYAQYGNFMRRFFTGEAAAGRLADTGPTRSALEGASATASLALPGLALALVVGVPIGLAVARRQWTRTLARAPVYLAVSLLPVWVGLWLSFLVGYKLGWLPLGGYCDVFSPRKDDPCSGSVEWAKALLLPWITFALPFAAIYGRVASRIAGDDRRRGLLLLGRMLGRDIGYVIGVSLFIEVAFGVPGLGARMLFAVESFSAEWTAAAFLVAILLAFAWHFLVDIAVAALDKDLRAEWPVAEIRGRA